MSKTQENSPKLWREDFPFPRNTDHKYKRGSLLVMGGGASTSGAARLGARAALRVGSGLVTTAFPKEALSIYACHQTAVMNAPYYNLNDVEAIFNRGKYNCFLTGPGHVYY